MNVKKNDFAISKCYQNITACCTEREKGVAPVRLVGYFS
jgi:hypothetical protein